jgi:hypothetical protein
MDTKLTNRSQISIERHRYLQEEQLKQLETRLAKKLEEQSRNGRKKEEEARVYYKIALKAALEQQAGTIEKQRHKEAEVHTQNRREQLNRDEDARDRDWHKAADVAAVEIAALKKSVTDGEEKIRQIQLQHEEDAHRHEEQWRTESEEAHE